MSNDHLHGLAGIRIAPSSSVCAQREREKEGGVGRGRDPAVSLRSVASVIMVWHGSDG